MSRERSSHGEADNSAVSAYKRQLQQVLENRPSGTRRRLAEALGKNRSFVSQITNPNYSIPIPARHVETILEVCHFLGNERAQFLDVYARAHPRRSLNAADDKKSRWRELTLRVPDLQNAEKNRRFDDLLKETAQQIERLLKER
ncbi:MAG: hypothetical protein EPO06_00815 [Burkholderiaceae bacterium]|nr:MAG: hypothetical protein EPO06_00815 [Burkholderiaceae bacterium]